MHIAKKLVNLVGRDLVANVHGSVKIHRGWYVRWRVDTTHPPEIVDAGLCGAHQVGILVPLID